MGQKLSDNTPPIEHAPVTPVFYDGCDPVRVLNGLVHMVLWQWKARCDEPGVMDKTVVGYIMARAETIAQQQAAVNDALRREGDAVSHDGELPLH